MTAISSFYKIYRHVRAHGGGEISTGGNCAALAIDCANGLQILVTDGDAGVDFDAPGALFVVSAIERATGWILAECFEYPAAGGYLSAVAAIATFRNMSIEQVKEARKV